MDRLEPIVQFLIDHSIRLVTAESCTAGLIVSELARVPGSGQVIDCGLTVYSPQAKHRYLGVAYDTIEREGLTSEAVAREMATGALDGNDATVALSNTGIAGPADGGPGQPAGTMCLAWAMRRDGNRYLFSETRHFEGERNGIRLATAHYSLERLLYYYAEVHEGRAQPIAPVRRQHEPKKPGQEQP